MKVKLGDFFRDLRLEKCQTLRQMAEKLGVSSAFLSAIENGKKNMPEKWLDVIPRIYDLDNAQVTELRKAAEDSSTAVKINLINANSTNRELAITFARSFKKLSESDSAKIMKILER